MAERFKVRVTKDHLVFCSGHFISYEGDKCERLHGHNYRAAVEVEGDLDENHYVFDFIALKHRTKAITDELDHRMMLPTRNPHIHARGGGRQRPRPLPGPRVALPARRLRAACRSRTPRPSCWPATSPSGCVDDLQAAARLHARRCCASRSRRTSASRRRASCGRDACGFFLRFAPASATLGPSPLSRGPPPCRLTAASS